MRLKNRQRNAAVIRLAAFALTTVLLASCAGMRGGAKPPDKISDGLVEMIREEYQLETIDQNQFILYKGTVRNWNLKEVYNVTADFVGFDKAGLPMIDFHANLTPKLQPDQSYSFQIKKHLAGAGLDRINAKVTYLRVKPSIFGAEQEV